VPAIISTNTTLQFWHYTMVSALHYITLHYRNVHYTTVTGIVIRKYEFVQN